MEAIRKSMQTLLVLALLGFSLAGALSLAQRDQPAADSDSTVTTKTTSGILRGLRQTAPTGSIIKFLAVPYAAAPIGSLRFKRPEELSAAQSIQVLDATRFGKTCPQYRHLTQFISPLLNVDSDHQTSEDCLQLNIFVPASVSSSAPLSDQQFLEPNKQLPVIVWIPGEGFDYADARQFDATNLALKTQSIVVTVQYRVGVLGFLHAPKLNVTGNMGVYDQIAALKWIRKNIDNFGGDSERVTLMGRFSGSMSISAMIAAPQHKQLLTVDGKLLFNRVALLSGIAVDDWIIEPSQEERVASLESAALARNYCNEVQIERGTCLSSMSVEQLLRVSNYGWRLVRDNELIGEQSPIEAIKSSSLGVQLDGVLLGETGMEGTLCMYRHALDTRTNYGQLIDEAKLTSNDLYNIIRDDSQTYFRYNPNKTNPIELALGSLIESSLDQSGQDESSRLREKYLNACSAYMVKSHLQRFKRNLVSRNKQLDSRMDSSKKPAEVYHYELRYKPSFSLAPDYIKTAAHGDDVPLIFGLVYNQPRAEINEADLLMTRKMMAYIGNFVHGNQPLLAAAATTHDSILNESAGLARSMDDEAADSQTAAAPIASLAASLKAARSWANEGQLHQIEFDESDLQELNARRRRHQQRRQSSNGSLVSGLAAADHASNGGDATDSSEAKSSVRPDRAGVNIRLIVVDGINQQQQQNEQTQGEIFVQRGRQSALQLADRQQQQPQPSASQQTNMTLINESSFVTMLVFGTCLLMFALMSICLGLCLIIFRTGSQNSMGKSRDGASIQQHYVNSSTSSCNICEESQGGSIDAVLSGARCKETRAFSNVFAKLRNNQASQSHHHPQQQQHQQQQPQIQSQPQQPQPIESQSCK